MSDGEQQQIAEDIAEIKGLLRDLTGRTAALENWRDTYQKRLGAQLLDISNKMEQQNVEVLRRVTRDMQVLVRDAMRSGMQELFPSLYREEKDKERKERREDMKDALHGTEFTIKYVYSILQLLVVIAVVYALVFR